MNSLHVPGDSRVHRLPAQPKLVATVLFVFVVVAIPSGHWLALGLMLALAVAVAAAAGLPARLVARRLVVEMPFVAFAAMLPFVAVGDRMDVGPLSLSRDGLVAGGTLLIKATTSVVVAIVLSATTTPRDLLAGVERLRLPAPLVSIAAFMIRYAGVVTDDLARMRTARLARGFDGRRLHHLKFEAAGAASLFVRSYERGERVHRAMAARGYTGRLPALSSARPTVSAWAQALTLPAIAGAVAVAGAWQ